MKKILKLAAIFVALVGIAIGALILSNSGGNSTKVTLGDNSNAEAIENDIIQDWKTAGKWSKTRFNAFNNEIEMSRKADLLTLSEAEELKELNCARASLVIVAALKKEFKKANCSKEVVSTNYDGLNTISKAGFSNTETSTMKSCCAVYFNILKFVGTAPKYDNDFKVTSTAVSWNNYQNYVDDQSKITANYLNDNSYKNYLSGINDLKNGLSKRSDVVKNYAVKYYQGVTDKFVNYYNNLLAEGGDLSSEKPKVTSAQMTFYSEVGSFGNGFDTMKAQFREIKESISNQSQW